MRIYQQVVELLSARERIALALIIDAQGSTPQKAGAAAIFHADGRIWGTLGGGCLEAEARRRALDALDTGAAGAYDLRLDDIRGWDDALICGGRVRIFAMTDLSANCEAYAAVARAAAGRGRGVLATAVSHPELGAGSAFWCENGDVQARVGGFGQREEALLARGKAARVIEASGEVEWFLEPVAPPPHLVIAGGGHVGHAVAQLALRVGFEVTLVDDRPEFADPARTPSARCLCGDIAETVGAQKIDAGTYVLVVTRGHRHDGKVLARVLGRGAAYVGMIGSRRKSVLVREALVAEGIATREEAADVVSPIGLDIGAETVEEIALSVVAQLVAHRRKGALAAGALNHAARTNP